MAEDDSSPSRGLAHPGWWLALALLLLNDHVLKASSLAGWVTGKLSDVAGLIVAPVLAAACLPRRWRFARPVAFAFVILCFCGLKLSEAVAQQVVAVAGALGLSWRIWSDPTDLLALFAVPLAYGISKGTLPCPSLPVRWRPALLRIGAFAGGVACIATSEWWRYYHTKAFITNLTRENIEVRMWHPSEPLDCSVQRDDPAAFDRSTFGLASCKRLQPRWVEPIDLSATVEDTGATSPWAPDAGPARACDAVLIRVAGAADTLVYWEAIEATTVDSEADKTTVTDVAAVGVFIEQFGDRRLVTAGHRLHSWPVDWTMSVEAPACYMGLW